MSTVSISVNKLAIGYGTKIVHNDLTFSLYAGEMVCMLGPNGSGKSTLLRTLAGLQPALGGDSNFVSLSKVELSKMLALVLTEKELLDSVTVRDVVAMGRFPYTSFLGGLREDDERIIEQSLLAAGMCNRESEMFSALSDGEKQRVLIAKALAQQTPVILLDEPTAHLDLPSRINVLQLLRDLAHREGKTILVSTHELDLALRYADRILLMSADGVKLDTADCLRDSDAFSLAFGMDIFRI